jgi:DNA-binding NtrC family response regulator
MMSAYHVVDRAVEAMKLGAYDYLIKPFHIEDMVSTLRRAAETLALRVRVHDTVQTAKGQYDFGRVVTQSPAMREVLEMARRASESERTTILIQGEKRHRQRSACQGDPLQQPAGANAADQSELRRSARYLARK